MDAEQVLSLLDSDDSARSHSSECLDLLEPRSNEEESEEEPPRPKASRSEVTYTSSEVCDLLCVSSTDDSLTTLDTSSSETDSDFDLSDPEAEIVQDTGDPEVVSVQDIDRPDLDNDSSSQSDTIGGIVSSDRRGQSRLQASGSQTKGRGRGQVKGRGRGQVKGRGRGRRQPTGQCGASAIQLSIHNLSEVDLSTPKTLDFTPLRSVGAHLPSSICEPSPADLFKLFFDEEIVQSICDASNEYAERNKTSRPAMYRYYKQMTIEDFYALVGIFIHLGYRKIPRYRLMWMASSLCYDHLISKVFSRNRFESYLSFLHIVNEDTEKKLKENGDKLCKVRPLNDHLQKRCKELYQPHREISIDERMVRSKARFSFRQYIRNKPVKWGFKLWVLCDSHNGYTSDFSIYRGKNGEVRSSNGLGYDVVMSLSKNNLSQGYSLYIDNFYTSPQLLSDLFDNGVHATGTLDVSRKGVPAVVSQLKKKFSHKSFSRGSGAYVRDGTCVYAVWRDTKCVAVMSNEHPGHSEETVTRNVKRDGVTEKKEVPIPVIIYNYNRFMNGVDRSDQLIKYYNVLRQTRKYWKTLFFHFIDIAIVNSYIIYKEVHPRGKLSHFNFRETLVRQLCRIEVTLQQTISGQQSLLTSHRSPTVEHSSVRMTKCKDCVYCKLVHGVRRQTTRKCSNCDAPLCLLARNCFNHFHQPKFKAQREKWLTTKSSQSSSTPIGRPKGSTIEKGRGKRKRKNW